MPVFRSLVLLACATLAATSTASAQVRNPHPQGLPLCEQALGKASSRFASKERQYWLAPLSVTTTREVREVALNPWGPAFIPRRFCSAIVATNDGLERMMYYVVEAGTGLAGIGYNVEVCVSGVDRNLAYAPNCKMAQP